VRCRSDERVRSYCYFAPCSVTSIYEAADYVFSVLSHRPVAASTLGPSGQLAGLSHGNKVKLRPTDFTQNVKYSHSLERITETRNESQRLKSPNVLHLDDHLALHPGAVEAVYLHKILRMS